MGAAMKRIGWHWRAGLGLLAGLGLSVSLGAAAQALRIESGHAREMPPGQTNSAAFMTLVNTGDRPVALVAATCDCADRAELHAHRHRDGMMSMERVARLEVPAGGRVALEPGGYHLMLLGLKRPLRAGEQVGITLLDEQGGAYSAQLPVVSLVKPAPAADGADHSGHH
jgi:copper(I)-binding protein